MKEPIKQYKAADPVPDKLELPKIKKEFPKVFKRISCPSCSENLNAEHIDLPNGVAKCGSCHVIFSIEEEVKSVKVKEEIKQEIFRPEGIDLFYYKGDLEIATRQPIHPLDAFAMIMFPFFAFMTWLMYLKKGFSINFPIFFAVGTLYFIYRAFTYNKAKSYIDINERLSLIHI